MKRILKLSIISLLIFSFLVPYTAFAGTPQAAEKWQDIELTDEEFNELLANNPNNTIAPLTSGLIVIYSISATKSGNNLIITGKTNCSPSVVKCGFSKLSIQIRKNSTEEWMTYDTYSSLYNDSSYYSLSKTRPIPEKYQCRVTCTHYAKKNLFSTEKIDNVSNIVYF